MSLSVCIVQLRAGETSETFLRTQAEALPARVTVVAGEPPSANGALIVPELERYARKALAMLRHTPDGERPAIFERAFRRFKPDVVLAQYGPVAVSVMSACRAARVPLVAHFHGYDASMYDVLRDYRERYAKLFAQAAAIVGVSRPMCDRLVGLGAPADKVEYNPYGVDCARFVPIDASTRPPHFIGVGRFVHKKGPHLTLVAFASVRQQVPDARLRFIGNGPLLGPCQDLAKALRIDDSVDFLGEQSHDRVQAEMSKARAFVQHSLVAADGDSEGTPVSIIEAGATGLPVVSTRHAGIPEVVAENETGILVDEHDVDRMAAGMLRLATDPGCAGRFGRSARERIVRLYSREVRIARLYEILVAAADRSRAKRVS